MTCSRGQRTVVPDQTARVSRLILVFIIHDGSSHDDDDFSVLCPFQHYLSQ